MIPFRILNRIVEIKKAKADKSKLAWIFNWLFIVLAKKKMRKYIKSDGYARLSKSEKRFINKELKTF